MNDMKTAMLEFCRRVQGKKIVIFGCGRRGRILGKALPCDIAYFVDNDPAKWEVSVEGRSVRDPQELKAEDKRALQIVVISYYYKPILWQLEEWGFKEDEHFINGLDSFGEFLNKELAIQEGGVPYDPKLVWLRGNPRIEGKCGFGGNNVVLDGSHLIDTTMERFSTVNRKCSIRNTKIGKFCSIGSEVMIGLERHPSRGFISTCEAFYVGKSAGIPSFVNKELFKEGLPVEIGNDVWIGSRAMILGGLTVGHGAIIGAGAIVTRDVEPYSVVAGVPAGLTRKRYSADRIEKLLEFAWWDRDMEWIRKNAIAFSDEEEFFKILDQDSKP